MARLLRVGPPLALGPNARRVHLTEPRSERRRVTPTTKAEPHGAARGGVPRGWYYVCPSRALRRGPVGLDVGPTRLATFRDERGRAVTLHARCSHMSADLSGGSVVNGRLVCPLHAWEYGGDGRCARIPAQQLIPPFACQPAYPTIEVGGHVVAANAVAPGFDFPFFEDRDPAEMRAARPFDFLLDVPWYLIGANAFDVQHFLVAHDRTLVDPPVVDSPAPLARRITGTYDVTGDSLRDRMIRRLAGPRVRMSVTVWGGTLVLVSAAFARTTSHGMVFLRPLGEGRTHVRVIVWIDRRRSALGRALLDPLDAFIRRRFIRAFLNDDADRTRGVRYNPATLIEADRELQSYMEWLAAVVTGSADTSNQRKAEHEQALA
jgi:nitrite reductase/ring-hydroxylating ferredoxin subunit